MSHKKYFTLFMTLLCTAALAGSEARAGWKTMAGAQGAQRRGCGDLVTLKHPEAKGPARKKEWDKCMADPNGYGG